MKRPAPRGVSGDGDRQPLRRLDHNRMFPWKIGTGTVFHMHPHPVQMDRMLHHRIVHKHQVHPFAVPKANRLVRFRICHAVERPHVPIHLAREMDLDLALWLPLIWVEG